MHQCFILILRPTPSFFFFFFNAPATTEIYTLSLHDALPIYWSRYRQLRQEFRRPEPSGSSAPTCRKFRAHFAPLPSAARNLDRKSTRLNSSHVSISYAVFCLKKKKKQYMR